MVENRENVLHPLNIILAQTDRMIDLAETCQLSKVDVEFIRYNLSSICEYVGAKKIDNAYYKRQFGFDQES